MASAYRSLRLEIEGRAFHSTLFARLHASKAGDTELPAQRTLFAVNVPHGATVAGLQAAFERLGAVSEVRLGSMTAEPATSSAAAAAAAATAVTAHVIFETPEALKAALKSTKALRLSLETAETAKPAESREALQLAVDGFLKRFEAEEAKREKEALAQKGKMDADGFVVVGRRGRPVPANASQPDLKKKKKKDHGETPDFYHFQEHERKREQLLKLREQFEADKARIAKMKTVRRNRPAPHAPRHPRRRSLYAAVHAAPRTVLGRPHRVYPTSY